MHAIQPVSGNHRLAAVLAFTMCLAALIVPACKRAAPAAPAKPSPGMRIVCLSPAVTDLLISLDLGDRVVGRDTWEEQLPDSIPRVGDLTSINLEAVVALAPTDIVLQAGKIGAPPRLEEVARQRGWNLINLQIDGLPDVQRAIGTLVEQLSFAEEAQSREVAAQRAQELVHEIGQALAPLPAAVTDRLGSIMVLYFTDPPSAYGPGSYVSDILESLGGRNVLTGGAWQELDLERVAASKPWALIIAEPEAGEELKAHPKGALGSLARVNLDCVRAGRLAVLSHPRSQLPGASVIGVAQELRTILEELARKQGPPEP